MVQHTTASYTEVAEEHIAQGRPEARGRHHALDDHHAAVLRLDQQMCEPGASEQQAMQAEQQPYVEEELHEQIPQCLCGVRALQVQHGVHHCPA